MTLGTVPFACLLVDLSQLLSGELTIVEIVGRGTVRIVERMIVGQLGEFIGRDDVILEETPELVPTAELM